MRHDLELGYLGIEVPEPESLTSFFGEVTGLALGEPTPGDTLTWRDDDKAHRIIVERGPANDVVFVGFEAVDAAAFERAVGRLRACTDVVDGSEGERKTRRVEELVWTTSPSGVRVELVVGLGNAATPFSSPLVANGFHTAGVGFGHAVVATTAFEEMHSFLVDGLGMGQSDWLVTEFAPGIHLEVRFYHCNARHHSVAVARRSRCHSGCITSCSR